jgi:hypothetical protein
LLVAMQISHLALIHDHHHHHHHHHAVHLVAKPSARG